MAIAIIVFVILIILFILLTEKLEIRILSKNALTVSISSVLFKVELSNFQKRKKKRRKAVFSASYSSLKFLLRHSELSVDEIAVCESAVSLVRASASALFSIFFAYLDTKADKISLPNDLGGCDCVFSFDIRIKARLYILISAFFIYKMKAFKNAVGVGQNVR